jgi:hypothetical protein
MIFLRSLLAAVYTRRFKNVERFRLMEKKKEGAEAPSLSFVGIL